MNATGSHAHDERISCVWEARHKGQNNGPTFFCRSQLSCMEFLSHTARSWKPKKRLFSICGFLMFFACFWSIFAGFLRVKLVVFFWLSHQKSVRTSAACIANGPKPLSTNCASWSSQIKNSAPSQNVVHLGPQSSDTLNPKHQRNPKKALRWNWNEFQTVLNQPKALLLQAKRIGLLHLGLETPSRNYIASRACFL